MIILITTLLIFLSIFYYLMVKRYNHWTAKGVKQGKPIWILGDNWGPVLRLHSTPELILRCYNRFPGTRYSGVYQFLSPVLLVKDPELIKKITVKDFDHFVDHRSLGSESADPLWTKNLVSLKGQKWREMRSILSPAFTSNKMKAMFVLISDCAEKFVQHFLEKDEDLLTLEMKDVFTRFTNDVIATTAFGIEVDSLGEPDNEFYKMGRNITNFTLFRALTFFGYFMFPKLYELLGVRLFSKDVTDFFVNVINTTIRMREEKGIVRPDMIHLLMEARKGKLKHEENGITDTGYATAKESEQVKGNVQVKLTNEDITAQALVFFFAGFDAVANLSCFVSYELAVNQDVQNKLRKEVLDTLKECEGKLTYDGLAKMKYMDMVVSEVLRKWPIAAATDRLCTKDYTIEPTTPDEKPLHLERGSYIWLPTFGIHRDPQFYPNPDKFDPERFSEQNKGNIKSYTYFPFGLGPRNCIGSRFALLETKAVFFHILSKFQLIPVERTEIPFKMSKKALNLTADGFWIGMKRIN